MNKTKCLLLILLILILILFHSIFFDYISITNASSKKLILHILVDLGIFFYIAIVLISKPEIKFLRIKKNKPFPFLLFIIISFLIIILNISCSFHMSYVSQIILLFVIYVINIIYERKKIEKYFQKIQDSIKLEMTVNTLKETIKKNNFLMKLYRKKYPQENKMDLGIIVLPENFDYDYIEIYKIYYIYFERKKQSAAELWIFYKNNKINRVLEILNDGFIEFERTNDGKKTKMPSGIISKGIYKKAIRYIDESKK